MVGEFIAKVCIVAKGYSRIILPHTAIIYSPVASTLKCGVHQLDVTSAFIYGKLPNTRHQEREEEKNKWITKTSYSTVTQVSYDLGKGQLPSEQCIFIKIEGREICMIVLLYVEDVLYDNKTKEINRFEDETRNEFKLKIMKIV
eukprot:snap_masked-scaffold_8-processed-gene-10.22-mRNA-1 protein AED:1.00 eAED:1.00 QI:0/0/0/0/1/1/4/0/143